MWADGQTRWHKAVQSIKCVLCTPLPRALEYWVLKKQHLECLLQKRFNMCFLPVENKTMAACCWHSAGNIAVLNLGTEPGISTTEGSKHGCSCAHMCPFLCTTVLLHLFAQLIQLKKPVEDYLVPDAFVKFPPTLVKQLWSPRGHENRAGWTGNAQAGRSLNFPCQKWWAAPSAQPVLCHSTSGHCAAVDASIYSRSLHHSDVIPFSGWFLS